MPPFPPAPSRRFDETEALRRAAFVAQRTQHVPDGAADLAEERAAFAAMALAAVVVGLAVAFAILVLA